VSDEIDAIRSRMETRSMARERRRIETDLVDAMTGMTLADGPPPLLDIGPSAMSDSENERRRVINERLAEIDRQERRSTLLKSLRRLGRNPNKFDALETLEQQYKNALSKKRKKEKAQKERRLKRWEEVGKHEARELRQRMHRLAKVNEKRRQNLRKRFVDEKRELEQKVRTLEQEEKVQTLVGSRWKLKKQKAGSGDMFRRWTIVSEFVDPATGERMFSFRTGDRGGVRQSTEADFRRKYIPEDEEVEVQVAQEPGRGAGEFRLERRRNSKGQLEVQAPEGEGKRTGKWYVAHGKIGKGLIAKYEKR
jgi:hypothetical protein